MRKHKWIRAIALSLCMVMLFTCLPASTFAQSAGTSDTQTQSEAVTTDNAQGNEQTAAQTNAANENNKETGAAGITASAQTLADTAVIAETTAPANDNNTSETKAHESNASESTASESTASENNASESTASESTAANETAGASETTGAAETTGSPETTETTAPADETSANDAASDDAGDVITFEAKMNFAALNDLAGDNPSVLTVEKTVDIKIDDDGNVTDGTMNVGKIDETSIKKSDNTRVEGKKFEGVYVVTYVTDAEGNKTTKVKSEDEIKYTGNYTTKDANGKDVDHIYYAFSETPDTGILLNANQEIKVVYRTVCNVTYEVRQDTYDGKLLNSDGSLDGENVKTGSGGGFVTPSSQVDKNASLNLQFKEEKNAKNSGRDYELVEVYQVTNGSYTKIEMDRDNTAAIESVNADTKIIAVVREIVQYKLTETPSRGHICWAGHGDEKNSNPSDPYTVDSSKFCSYDTDGSVTGTKGATVVAEPDGTIYFVMYSQKGDKWQLQHMIINDVFVDTTCDGKVHDTDLGNGMVAHFQYLGDEKNDSHLKDNAGADRNKFACWVTNVSSDINVDFQCESEKRETLTLVQADGIAQVVASTYDRAGLGSLAKDYWDGIYNGDNSQKEHNGQKFPNLTLTWNDIGKDLVNEYWSGSKNGHRNSDNKHTSVEDKKSDGYGSRYVYFKVKAGYDPNTLTARITGQDTPLQPLSIAQLATNKYKQDLFGWITTTDNKSVKTAKQEGYDWFVSYQGVGQYFRQLSLSADPYTYGVVYELDGGTLSGQSSYTDSNRYTIESGSNTIIMPSATPVKEGYIFQGWELVPTNGKYTTESVNRVLDESGKFVIDATTYEYGLETVKTTYELDGTTYTDWNAVSGGDHKFTFKATWLKEDDTSSTKANYTITSYKEITKTQYDALAENVTKTEKDGKYYQVYDKDHVSHVGTVGETIVGVPSDAPEGYVLSDNSITRLDNFKKDGNNAAELIYYYDISHTLTVNKVLTGEYADKTKSFEVTVSLKDAKGNAVNGTFDCTGTSASISDGKITFKNGTAKVLLKGGQSITISGLSTGTYSVSETPDANYDVTYAIDNAATDNNGKTAPTDKALSATFEADGSLSNALTTVTVTNARKDEVPAGVVDGHSPIGWFAVAFAMLAACVVGLSMRASRRRVRFGSNRNHGDHNCNGGI